MGVETDPANLRLVLDGRDALPARGRPDGLQFRQVPSNHVSAHDVRAHYHVDPAATDVRDFGRLETLFDAVVRVTEGDEVAVRTR